MLKFFNIEYRYTDGSSKALSSQRQCVYAATMLAAIRYNYGSDVEIQPLSTEDTNKYHASFRITERSGLIGHDRSYDINIQEIRCSVPDDDTLIRVGRDVVTTMAIERKFNTLLWEKYWKGC